MKRLTWLAPLFTVVGLGSLPVACFTSSATPPGDDSGGPGDDSGTPGDDASPDVTMTPIDSGPGDATSDATSAADAPGPVDADAAPAVDATDALPTTVTVTVLLGTVPEPG